MLETDHPSSPVNVAPKVQLFISLSSLLKLLHIHTAQYCCFASSPLETRTGADDLFCLFDSIRLRWWRDGVLWFRWKRDGVSDSKLDESSLVGLSTQLRKRLSINSGSFVSPFARLLSATYRHSTDWASCCTWSKMHHLSLPWWTLFPHLWFDVNASLPSHNAKDDFTKALDRSKKRNASASQGHNVMRSIDLPAFFFMLRLRY